MPQDSSEKVKDYLETIEYYFPEIFEPKWSEELIRLKGVIQFSDVEAVGFSWYEENWHRQDRFLIVSKDFDLDLIEVSIMIDDDEMRFPKPPKTLLWYFSKIRCPLEKNNLFRRYIINPL